MLLLRFWKRNSSTVWSTWTGKQAASGHERTIRLLPARVHFNRLQLILLRHATGESAPAGVLAEQNQVCYLEGQAFHVTGNHQRAWQPPSWNSWTLKTALHEALTMQSSSEPTRGSSRNVTGHTSGSKISSSCTSRLVITQGVSQLLEEGKH